MEWQVTDAQSLGIIDREMGEHSFAPAEYEIVRRVILATGDFSYKSLIRFSEFALQAGAAALASRTPLLVDVPMVQAGIRTPMESTFVNPIHCCSLVPPWLAPSHPMTLALGMEILAQQYPEGIFVVGQSYAALSLLLDLIEAEAIRPAFLVATPARFMEDQDIGVRLHNTLIPHLRIEGRKGGSSVAVAVMEGLIDLAWQAYGQEENEVGQE